MRRRSDFLLCYDAGNKRFSRQFVVFFRNREDDAVWRAGFAVTRKTGCAVVRNRVRRVLREFFRLHQAEIPHGYDVVVVPKRTLTPSTLTLSIAERELLPIVSTLSR